MNDTKENELPTKTGGWPEVKSVGGDSDEEVTEESSSSPEEKED